MQLGIDEVSEEIPAARWQVHGMPKNSMAERRTKAALRAALKTCNLVRERALDRFLEGCVRQLEERSREEDQAGLYTSI